MSEPAADAGASPGPRPLVSVVVPVYNGERYLRESIDSILGQSHEPVELIVLDDCSTDSTPEIVASYGARVRSVRQAATKGIYANANDGIALASGAYVGVFHADDVYLPELVAREVAWLEQHPEAGAVFCSDVFVDESGQPFGRLTLPSEIRPGQPLGYAEVVNGLLRRKNAFLRCPTALVPAAVYRALGPYDQERYRNTSDLEMWLRIARSYPIGVLADHLLLYRRGHGSSSERYHRLRTDPERFFAIMDEELGSHGAASVATSAALAAYEAHRSEDALRRAISHYVQGRRHEARRVLRSVSARALARSDAVRRARLVPLALGLKALFVLPRLAVVARAFDARLRPPAAGTGRGAA